MENFEVCLCNKVMRNTIVKAIHEKELTSFEEVQYETKAGSVCGGCIPNIEELLIDRNNNASIESVNSNLNG